MTPSPCPAIVLSCLAGWLTWSSPAAWAADETPARSYQDGPLTRDDYQASPPDDSPLSAWTVTDVRWDYRYRYQQTGRTITAYLTEFKVDAVVVPAQSWNRHPANKRLQDHEQGHFDVAMIAAWRTRLKFADESQRRQLTATGSTPDAAIENLRNKLDRELRAIRERLLGEHKEYDRVTQHGRAHAAQAEQRKAQLATLRELAAAVKKLEAKRQP
jgi:hypothetical protein